MTPLAPWPSSRPSGSDLSIDDFGTGYSSLSRLHRFDLDDLKVDRSFVVGMTERPQDEIIVTMIVGLARALGLAVVAEGIETQEQLDRLAAMGCHHGQGYFFGRSVSAEAALAAVTGLLAPHEDSASTATSGGSPASESARSRAVRP